MNHSDDYPSDSPSPSAPFSGDDTGDIFDTPDLVQLSQPTTERVVDTQSGFLVVVKPIDSRLTLSVKRRLGTPPVSYITLTPDEALKLAKILSNFRSEPSVGKKKFFFGRNNDAKETEETQRKSSNPKEDRQSGNRSQAEPVDQANEVSGDYPENLEGSPFGEDPSSEFARIAAEAGRKRTRSYREQRAERRTNRVTGGQIVTVSVCLIAIPALIWGAAFFAGKYSEAPKPVPVSELERQKIDKFSRDFIADMLDFNPSTYKASQIRAMASMTPELLEKYWQETNFPLSPKQLKLAPHDQTLMISAVDQSAIVENQRQVDIMAELVSARTKVKRPVHIRLKVEDSGQLRVLSQEDLSAAK